MKAKIIIFIGLTLVNRALPAEQPTYSTPVRDDFPTKVFWGDTHLHTNLSGDAVFKLGPEEAYRFARGEKVISSTGQSARLSRPLDFIVIADHANNMGAQISRQYSGNDETYMDTRLGRLWAEARNELLANPDVNHERLKTGSLWPGNRRDVALRHPGFRQAVWDLVTSNADKYNNPGSFTAFVGYEWTSNIAAQHRVVLFKDPGKTVRQVLPFSSWDGPQPEALWDYLERYSSQTGGDAISIPHNSNLTFGRMFAIDDSTGEPFTTDYARTRSRWEPIAEITQIKGDSETHPIISPDDEFADFERWNGWAGREEGGEIWNGNRTRKRPHNLIRYEYVRSALQLGLAQAQMLGVNPFKFGVIGSTDAHTALSATTESNFWGKTMYAEPKPARANQAHSVYNWEMSASGYAAVWAQENTRESLFNALRRREAYATTGSRITLRVFAGWDFDRDDAHSPTLARQGYQKGVPMGGDLTSAPSGARPQFLIAAARDPEGAQLDRIQVIKGWIGDAGETKEQVYNVAVSDLRRIRGNRVRPVGNTVDVATATYTNTIGDPELRVVWQDPNFDRNVAAVYYVRVLEIPTPRWTAYDAAFYGTDVPSGIPMVIQERAYSSAIWYTP